MPAALYVLYRAVPKLDGPMEIHHEGHLIRAVIVDAPVPAAEMDRCLPVAHLRPEHKEELRTHRAHIALMHTSNTPGPSGLVAMYAVARALNEGKGLIGVINPITCMCLTTKILDSTLEPEFVAAALKNPAQSFGLWLGFVKLFRDDGGTWLVTTGGGMVGLPNLALLAANREDVDKGIDMLATVWDHLYAKRPSFGVGDTMDLAGTALKVRAPYEYVQMIGAETLVLEPA